MCGHYINIIIVKLSFRFVLLFEVAAQCSVVMRFRALGKKGFSLFGCGCYGLSDQVFDCVFGGQGYNCNLITRSFMNFGFCSGSFNWVCC